MIVADTSGLLALFNRAEPDHEAVVAVIEGLGTPPIVSPYVLAELDYLVATRLGVAAELAVLRELSAGAYELPTMDAEDVVAAAELVDRYADQEIGLADASVLVLAARYGTRDALTLDRRHFDVLRLPDGAPVRVLPA